MVLEEQSGLLLYATGTSVFCLRANDVGMERLWIDRSERPVFGTSMESGKYSLADPGVSVSRVRPIGDSNSCR